MKRIIWHWSAGPHKATKLDKKHYHYIFEGDGNMVTGDNPVSANEVIRKGKPYAAHTYRSNTGSIGVSMACMLNARERPLDYGSQPMTEVQFEACMKYTAELCKKYNIKVTNKTVLSHAEVQPNLGIKQRGKWDFTVLPFKPKLRGAKACGDYARQRVKFYMGIEDLEIVDERVAYLQRLLTLHGYDLKADGIVGGHTRQAISQFQRDMTLEVTGTFNHDTVALLRTAEKDKATTKKNNISDKPLTKSRTAQGATTAATGGAIVLVEPVKEVVDVITEQQDVISNGSLVTLVLGGVIIFGALYALYARWDDAGRPKLFGEN